MRILCIFLICLLGVINKHQKFSFPRRLRRSDPVSLQHELGFKSVNLVKHSHKTPDVINRNKTLAKHGSMGHFYSLTLCIFSRWSFHNLTDSWGIKWNERRSKPESNDESRRGKNDPKVALKRTRTTAASIIYPHIDFIYKSSAGKRVLVMKVPEGASLNLKLFQWKINILWIFFFPPHTSPAFRAFILIPHLPVDPAVMC